MPTDSCDLTRAWSAGHPLACPLAFDVWFESGFQFGQSRAEPTTKSVVGLFPQEWNPFRPLRCAVELRCHYDHLSCLSPLDDADPRLSSIVITVVNFAASNSLVGRRKRTFSSPKRVVPHPQKRSGLNHGPVGRVARNSAEKTRSNKGWYLK